MRFNFSVDFPLLAEYRCCDNPKDIKVVEHLVGNQITVLNNLYVSD